MNAPKLKFCGIRRWQDITYLNACMPDYAGFVFAKSPRQISATTAAALEQELHPAIKRVGVFVNEPIESLLQTAVLANLDALQLHGDEDENYIRHLRSALQIPCEIWKAVRVRKAAQIANANRLPVDKLLFDSFAENTYGGTGTVANWQLLRQANAEKPFFLAGGLNSQNIMQGIHSVQPFGVDLSGGIETDGYKDKEKMLQITKLVKQRK